jgi:arsenate reductase (thioredoxin)
MTEEYIRLECGDAVDVESAGIEPGEINPVVVELLKEDGVDITGKKTRSVFDLHAAGNTYDYVIAVCNPEAAEQCPIFPAEKERLHWPFPDPSKATGSLEEKLAYIRPIRDTIKAHVAGFCRKLEKEAGET